MSVPCRCPPCCSVTPSTAVAMATGPSPGPKTPGIFLFSTVPRGVYVAKFFFPLEPRLAGRVGSRRRRNPSGERPFPRVASTLFISCLHYFEFQRGNYTGSQVTRHMQKALSRGPFGTSVNGSRRELFCSSHRGLFPSR